ncbi:MAG: phospholipid carrier-dependent glycosyltransferase, partial [Actinomycetes bacterium]
YILALPGSLETPTTGFVAARMLAVLATTLGAWVLGRIALRTYGLGAAVVSMVVFATIPEAAAAGRSVLIEPYLNLATLAVAWWWLTPTEYPDAPHSKDRSSPRSAWAAGVALGVALSFKWWAVALVVPILITARLRPRSDLLRLLGGAALSGALVTGSAVLAAPADAVRQTMAYQLTRRAGPSLVDRTVDLFGAQWSHLATRELGPTLVGVTGLIVLVTMRRRDVAMRFAGAWYSTIVAMFAFGWNYFIQYNAHLAPALGLLAAGVTAQLSLSYGSPRRLVRVGVGAACVALCIITLSNARWARGDALARYDNQSTLTPLLQRSRGSVFAFDPGVVLLAGRLPDTERVGRVASDPFLAGALGRGELRFTGATSAATIRSALRRADLVVIDEDGSDELGPLLPWFQREFVEVARDDRLRRSVWSRRDVT